MARVLKTNRFDVDQWEQLKELSKESKRTTSSLIDQALDLLLLKYRLTPKTKYNGSLRLHKGQWSGQFSFGVDEKGKRIRKEIYIGTASKMDRIEAQKQLDYISEHIEEYI